MPTSQLTPAAQRRAAAREAILAATHAFVAVDGFRDIQMAQVAHRAGVSVGAIYNHFPSRADLLAEVYVRAVTHELDLVREAIAVTEGARGQIAIAVDRFCRRAIAAGRFGHALLTEPTDPAVDEHRLAFRENYRALFAGLIESGSRSGELPPQDPDIAAAAVLGVMTETLVRPLSAKRRTDPDLVVPAIVGHCLATLGAATAALAPTVGSSRRRRP